MATRGTVFLVDDDDAFRRATTRLLVACGFDVREFGSAEEYLAAHDPATPACLLLDLRLSGRSGLELQRSLADRDTALPIVFLTGHGDSRARARALKDGAVDFLQKPAREEQLIDALERALALTR